MADTFPCYLGYISRPGDQEDCNPQTFQVSLLTLQTGWLASTLPETNSLSMKIPIVPGKYHQNGGFSMAMLVYRSVTKGFWFTGGCF